MKSTLSPQVQAVFDRLGYYIRHYPQLSQATGNAHFSIVFSRLLYHEDLRLKRHAAFFARTDTQLASECGLGEYECAAARDLICAPQTALFTKERHGIPPINHYRGNHAHIHAWLSAHGFSEADRGPAPNRDQEPVPDWDRGQADSIENRHLFAGTIPNQRVEKPALLKETIIQKSDEDDDARSARIRSAEQLLKDWGIENPTRQRILNRLGNRSDLVEVIRTICESTSTQWALGLAIHREIIKRPAGLIISRLLNEVEP